MGGQVKPVRGPYLALVGALGVPVTHSQGGDVVSSDVGECDDVEAVGV